MGYAFSGKHRAPQRGTDRAGQGAVSGEGFDGVLNVALAEWDSAFRNKALNPIQSELLR